MPQTIVDFLGNTIRAGDTLVYPVRRKSQLYMNKIRVAELVQLREGFAVTGYNDEGRRVTVRNLHNTVVVGGNNAGV